MWNKRRPSDIPDEQRPSGVRARKISSRTESDQVLLRISWPPAEETGVNQRRQRLGHGARRAEWWDVVSEVEESTRNCRMQAVERCRFVVDSWSVSSAMAGSPCEVQII